MGFFVTTVGDYLWNFIPMGFQTFNDKGAAAWQGGWTIFYWGWVDFLGRPSSACSSPASAAAGRSASSCSA